MNDSSKSPRTNCANCALRQIPIFRKSDAKEIKFIQRFKSAEMTVERGGTILVEGHDSPHLFTILSGWAFRYKALPDDRRQVIGFSLPGDFLGLQGPVFKEMQHSVEALMPTRLCVFPRARLWEVFTSYPELSYDIAWLSARGESIADEHLLAVGQRTATERVAYLFLHLFERCKALQLTRGRSFHFPVTQQHIADALGLSLVHTNKTIARLQRSGLVRWSSTTVELLDEDELRVVANYEEGDGRPRPLV